MRKPIIAILFLTLLTAVTLGQRAQYDLDLSLGNVQWNQKESNIEVTGVVTNSSNSAYHDVLISAYCSDSDNYRLATLHGRVDYVGPGDSASFKLLGGSPNTVAKVQTAIVGGTPGSSGTGW